MPMPYAHASTVRGGGVVKGGTWTIPVALIAITLGIVAVVLAAFDERPIAGTHDSPKLQAVKLDLKRLQDEREAVAAATKERLGILDPEPAYKLSRCAWADDTLDIDACSVDARHRYPRPCTAAMHAVCLHEASFLSDIAAREVVATERLIALLDVESLASARRRTSLNAGMAGER